MSDNPHGGPAFPVPVAEIHGIATHSGEFGDGMTGMSLRDYFAAQVANGNVAAYAGDDLPLPTPDSVATYAYRVADAMLAERAK